MKSRLWHSVVGWSMAGILAVAAVPAGAQEVVDSQQATKKPKVIGVFIPQDRLASLAEELAELSGLSPEEIRAKIAESGREVTPRRPRHGVWGGHGPHHRMGPKGAHPGWRGEHPRMNGRFTDPEAREAFIERMKERTLARLDQWLEDGRITQEEYDALKQAITEGDWEALHRHWHAMRGKGSDDEQ